MLEVRDVTKRFGEVVAVDSVSFDGKPGEIFGLLGPNGAGKSTTIRMIMNIIAPDTGTIRFMGHQLGEADKDRIGYLPEERGLYKKVTVVDMILYLASLKNMSSHDAIPRIAFWLDRFGLSDWRERKIGELSKGMAQKVQFITSVVHDPEFIFLDEPFAGLDPVSTDVMREAVVELNNSGKTILFSTHNMEQAERICHRILILDHGREVVQGSVAEIKERYGKKSVAVEFDGEIDFLKGVPAVRNVIHYPRWAEIELEEGHSPDEVLQLLAGKVSITRFEVLLPSLHKIFVDQLGHGSVAEPADERADGRTQL
jgi:ABC-2 type transport system ATP-binding protein